MSWFLGVEVIAELIAGAGVGVGVVSALSVIKDYFNKKNIREIKVGYKDLELKGISKEDIEKILNEISKIKKNPQVFIMYSYDEKELAKRISNDLEDAGVKIWLDEQQIKLGDSISEKIQLGLDESQWIIFIPPKKTDNKNSWISKEMNVVLNSEKWRDRHFVIPVKTRDGIIPDSLKDRMWVDFSENYDVAINKLKSGILRTTNPISNENAANSNRLEISSYD